MSLATYAQEPSLIVQRGHTAPITDVVISPKNNLLFTTSHDKTIKYWDLTSGKELKTFADLGIEFSPAKLVLSHDETKLFAIISSDNTLIFDLTDFENIPLKGNSEETSTPLHAVSHPSQNRVVVSYDNFNIREQNFLNPKEKIKGFNQSIDDSEVTKIEYSKTGKYCLAVTEMGSAVVYDENKKIITQPFPKQKITSFAFHPSIEDNIATLQSDSTLSYLQFAKKKLIKKQKLPFAILHLSWLNDNELLLMDEEYQLYRLNIQTFESQLIPLSLPRFYIFKSLGNNKIIYNEGPVLNIVDVNDLEHPKTFQGYVGNVYESNINAVLFTEDSRNIIMGGGAQTVSFWGEVNTQDIEVGFEIKKMVLSPNGQLLAVSGKSNQWKLIDVQKKEVIQTFEGHENTIKYIRFLDDSEVITGSKDNSLIVWSIKDNQQSHTLQGHTAFLTAIHSYKNVIASADMEGKIIIWDRVQKKQIQTFSSSSAVVYQLLFSKNGEQLFVGKDDGSIDIWDWKNGKQLKSVKPFDQPITNLKYIQDKIAISSTLTDQATGSPILTLNEEDWKVSKFLDAKSEGVYSFNPSSNERFIVSSGLDNLVHLWDIKTNKKLASIYTLGNGEWAIITPDGLFDASPNGMQLLHFVYQYEAIDLNQLKTRYYEPDLLQKLLGYNEEPIRQVSTFSAVKLYPKANIVLEKDFLLGVKLAARNGGIGKVSVFFNNKEIIEDANPARQADFKIDLKPFKKFLLSDTTNKISIKVFNEEGWMHSDWISVDYRYEGTPRGSSTDDPPTKLKLNSRYQPKFYALVIGTSDYRGEALDLSFADKDAEDMAHALTLTGNELFGAENVGIHLLNTTQANDRRPTKENIKKTFEALSTQIQAEDVFLIYLSGHGVNYGSPNSLFYYLTESIASEDITDQSIRDNYTISSQELTTYLKSITANKQIMILDACSSGSLVNNILSQTRSVSSSQKRAFDRMKDRTGVFILAGSAADKVSYEASAFGQGLLTYSLLSGMRGGALRENQFVDVMQLFQYAADKVPQLATVIGGVQRPVIAAPNGTNSFDIGQVTDSVRYQIVLEEIKPLIIRSNFQHETLYEDILDLSDRLDAEFAAIAGERVSSIIFLNVKKYPKAYSVKGRYNISDDNIVSIEAKVLQDKTILNNIQLSGSKDNLDALISELLDKVAEVLNQ